MDQANELRRLISQVHLKKYEKNKLNAKVITVTSGKGGVGKSNFSLNLALYFHSIGKKVLIIDADFGCANIEILFDCRPQYSFKHIISGEKNISEVISSTSFGIKFISGGSGFKDLSNLTNSQINYFIEQFEYLDNLFDIIIIDTSAGISRNVTNFANAANEIIVITTPEPTSFTDAYAFMKVVKETSLDLPKVKLVVNKAENYFEAINVYSKLSTTSKKFLNINLENLGYIPLDNNIINSVKKQQPIILSYPNSKFSEAIRDIGSKLNKSNEINTKVDTGIKGFMKKLVNVFNK